MEDFARLVLCDDDGESVWLCPEVEESERTRFDDGKIKGVDVSETNEFIASTGREARDGDIIDQDSWQLGPYKRNPVILQDHFGPVVGRSLKTWVNEGSLRTVVQWDDDPLNEAGRLVAHQHRSGFRKAVSVRWRAGKLVRRDKLEKDDPRYSTGQTVQGVLGSYKRVGFVHFRSVLYEISSVSVPGDPRALQVRGLGDKGLERQIRQHIEAYQAENDIYADQGFRDAVRDVVLYLIRTDKEVRTAARALGLFEPRPTDEPLTLRGDGLDFLFPHTHGVTQ